uniref:Methyltransferase small domain-containing protein n=1 Tax=Panagrolaimus superbus TaxID=310955 RepID=A0A914YX34_9BILA
MSLSFINENELYDLALTLKKDGYHFVTITPASIERVNSRAENVWAKSIIDVLGWSRPFSVEKLPFNNELLDLMKKAGILVENKDKKCWKSLVRISSLNNELFIHSAFPTENDDSVFFGPDTYRFARVIKSLLNNRKNPVHRGVDIGCGAGPGAILLAKAYPQAEIFGVDINENALRLTNINSRLANVNVKAQYSDLLKNVDGQFDIIISNPPYLNDPLQRKYRHGGGNLGSQLSFLILKASLERLYLNGVLLLYTASAIIDEKDIFYEEVRHLIENAGTSFEWTYGEIDPDVFGEELLCHNYSHVDRIAAIELIVHKTK